MQVSSQLQTNPPPSKPSLDSEILFIFIAKLINMVFCTPSHLLFTFKYTRGCLLLPPSNVSVPEKHPTVCHIYCFSSSQWYFPLLALR